MPLSITQIKNAKSRDKAYKITDEKGMYLLVSKTCKAFRLDFRFVGKRKTLAIGTYPDISLKRARELRDIARAHIADGVDPCELKKNEKLKIRESGKNSFETVALEWLSGRSSIWTPKHTKKMHSLLKRDIFPFLSNKQVEDIKAREILTIVRKIEDRNAIDTAHRAKQICSQIFRFAVATDRVERDPTTDLRGALRPIKRNNFATIIEPQKVGELLRAIDGYEGYNAIKYALQIAPLVFVRPGELRNAEWTEIDLEKAEWRIPASKMKKRNPHIIPLASQTIALLKELSPYTGHGRYLFPSVRSDSYPISDNTINAALRRLGYTKTEMTGHGFRGMASTLLHEKGWQSDIIERQLAHQETNLVKASYNHAQHLLERKEMMQFWADYLDDLRKN